MKGWIYALSKDMLIREMAERGLNTEGNLEELRKRLSKAIDKAAETDPLEHAAHGPRKPDESSNASFETVNPPDQATVITQLRRWGYQFDGRDPLSFLDQVEELKEGYGLTDQQIFKGLTVLLKGAARVWYRNNKHRWTTWQHFITSFRRHYLPAGYQRQARMDAYGRKQRRGETFDAFLEDLQTLIRRAGGMTESEELELIYENMHASLQLYIHLEQVENIEDLTERVARCERLERRQRADEPTRPESAGRTNNGALTPYDKSEHCWRCKQRGHTRATCKRPAKKFCSQCGKDGVFTKECHPPPENYRRSDNEAATRRT